MYNLRIVMKRKHIICIIIITCVVNFLLLIYQLGGDSFDENLRNRMLKRRLRLQTECSKIKLNKDSIDTTVHVNSEHFFYNKQYHILWCTIFKAASTSWIYNFNLMANYTKEYLESKDLEPFQLAKKKYPRIRQKDLLKAQFNSITFMIVRHPFERLVSVYNDKILNPVNNSMYDRWGPKIIQKFRNAELLKLQNQPKRPLFEEFIDYVIDEAMHNKYDEHWAPYSEFCSVCSIDYNIIMKVETLDEDQRYFIEYANLSSLLQPKWENRGKIKNGPEVISNLYKNLSLLQLYRLEKMYEKDLRMFDYDTGKYYELLLNALTEV